MVFNCMVLYNYNYENIKKGHTSHVKCNLKFDKSEKLHFNNQNILIEYGQYVFKTICHAREEDKKEPFETYNYNTRHNSNIVTSHVICLVLYNKTS